MTTTFQLVRDVLNELYGTIVAELGSEDAANSAIRQRLEELSTVYGQLANPTLPPIDYASPVTRFAYIFSAVTLHSDFLVQALSSVQKHVDPLFSEGAKCVVSCLGGGPGSDLIGLVQYLIDSGSKVKSALCHLRDYNQAWGDSWADLGQKLDTPFQVHVDFQWLDVRKPESWQHQRKFLAADLFISSYFASEVMRVAGEAMGFWQDVFVNAKPGALLLFTDFESPASTQYIDSISTGLGWELVEMDARRRFARFKEQKSELDDFIQRLGRSPRVQGDLHIRLLRKP